MSELKFKLTSETKVNFFGVTLFRIEATVDFMGVKKGDKGGWVESEKLPNGNARVSGDAWVSGDAEVYGNAMVYGDAEVYGNAMVYGNAEVYGNAMVSGNARVYGNAMVSGDAEVYGNAMVSGNAKIKRRVINVICLYYNITAYSSFIQIGCELHTIKDWKDFSDERISKMDSGALEWWNEWKDTVIKLAESYGESS